MKSFRDRFIRTPNKPVDQDENNEDDDRDEDNDDETSDDNDDLNNIEENIEAYLIPSDNEKKAVLASFDAMRKDSLFCDVAFICQGIVFRAHRVIVSSWSRWMRAFLCDSPEEEVLALDFFTPNAFMAVLDYMYGISLKITLEVTTIFIQLHQYYTIFYIITCFDFFG